MPVQKSNKLLAEWRSLVTYAIDWDNPEAFDKEGRFIGYELFAGGKLTEAWLKKHTKVAWNEISEIGYHQENHSSHSLT